MVGGFGATMMLHATVAALSEMILKVKLVCLSLKPVNNFSLSLLSEELYIKLPSGSGCSGAASIL